MGLDSRDDDGLRRNPGCIRRRSAPSRALVAESAAVDVFAVTQGDDHICDSRLDIPVAPGAARSPPIDDLLWFLVSTRESLQGLRSG